MRMAVTSRGEKLTSEVDTRFGRAAKFVIVDTETDAVEVMDNTQNLNASQGAGIQAAQNVANAKVEVVLTGHCGPNAFRTLNAAGIQVVTNASGTVGQAVEDFKAGKLKASGDADVEGHWV